MESKNFGKFCKGMLKMVVLVGVVVIVGGMIVGGVHGNIAKGASCGCVDGANPSFCTPGDGCTACIPGSKDNGCEGHDWACVFGGTCQNGHCNYPSDACGGSPKKPSLCTNVYIGDPLIGHTNPDRRTNTLPVGSGQSGSQTNPKMPRCKCIGEGGPGSHCTNTGVVQWPKNGFYWEGLDPACSPCGPCFPCGVCFIGSGGGQYPFGDYSCAGDINTPENLAIRFENIKEALILPFLEKVKLILLKIFY